MPDHTAGPARIANRYQLLEKLGEGGMGAVYRAQDRLTRQIVALKQVITPLDRVPTPDNSDSLLALAVEFRALAGLRHPNIISVLDYGFNDAGQPFITMEFLSDARTILQAAEDQPQATKIRLIAEMLLALAYLHRRGILHRDLKPDNVLVTASGEVKVLDFGLATGTITRSTTGVTEDAVGTMAYMAPELFADTPASVQSDLYAVGVIAYEIFVGSYPFVTKNMVTLFNDIVNKTPDTSMLDFDLGYWLDHLLAKNPDDRPRDAAQVTDDLCQATQHPLPPESPFIRESFLQASKFVGRDTELDQLKTYLDQSKTGETHFVLIGGESGVGKSRLVDELRIRALVEGAVVVRGQAVAEGGAPFQLWVEPIRRLVLSTPLSDLEAGILKDPVPDIGELIEREAQPAPEISGSAWQQRLILTMVEIFTRQTKPMVLILEDLHWSTESLAVLKQMLKVRDQLSSLLVMGTYRDDEKPELSEKLAGMQHLSLKRFDTAAIADLSESMLGETGKQSQVVELLQRETEGNAFFMVEVVRALAEDAGSLAGIGQITLPAQIFAGGIQQVIQRRLNRLPDTILTWLKPIAVAGRQVDLALVNHLQPESQQKHNEFLTLCVNAVVLEVVEGAWRVSHDKIREALLAELSAEERTSFQRQVAQAIETIYPDDHRYYEVLLEHWHQAGDLDKEIFYLTPVAKHLVNVTADHAQARILLKRGLERLTEQDGRRAALLNWLARSYWRQGEYTQSQPLAQQALELAQQIGDQQGIAFSFNNLGNLAIETGDRPQAQAYYQQAQTIYEAIGDQEGLAFCLNNLGTLADEQQDFAQAQAYYQQCLTIRQAIGDQWGIAMSLNNLGVLARDQGDYPQAQAYYQQSLTISQAIGDQTTIAISLGNLGDIAYILKDYPQAQAFHQQSLTISQAIGDQWGMTFGFLNLGVLADNQGNYPQAQVYLQQSLTISQTVSIQWGVAASLTMLGFVYLKAQPEFAPTTFRQALILCRDLQLVPLTLDLLIGFAKVHLQAGDPTRAAELAGLATHHSAHNSALQERLDELMPQLQVMLSMDALTAATERGKALDLEATVQALLTE